VEQPGETRRAFRSVANEFLGTGGMIIRGKHKLKKFQVSGVRGQESGVRSQNYQCELAFISG
jgi:hypothetical protein